MLHNCTYCDYNTTVKGNLRRHIRNKHGNNKNGVRMNSAPTTVSVTQMWKRIIILSKLIRYVKKVLHVISNFQNLFQNCTFWLSSILTKRQAYRPILLLTFLFENQKI